MTETLQSDKPIIEEGHLACGPWNREVGYVSAPFGQALEIIKRCKGEVISSSFLAYARMSRPICHSFSQVGCYTSEGVVYVPGERPCLVRESPLLALYIGLSATKSHETGREYHVWDKFVSWVPEQIERDAKLDPKERKIIRLDQKANFNVPIPTQRFADDEITCFLFEDQAKDWGNYLNSIGIKEMPIWLVPQERVDREPKPFVRQLWNSRIGGIYRFYLGGNGDLDHGGRVRATFGRS
jgi:hypothetical protein